ncbi:MAG: outer membrane protein [Spirochaetota bacterium]
MKLTGKQLMAATAFLGALFLTAEVWSATPDKVKLQKTKTAKATATEPDKHQEQGAAQDIEVGVIVGYNPNIQFDRSGQAYQSGEDAFGVPIWSFGVRGKMDFGAFGVRGAATYSFSPERFNSRSTTATPNATPYVESGNGVLIPFSFCINPVKTDKAAIYVGAGLGYSSYNTDAKQGTVTYSTKTSGIDWNFLFGTELFLAEKFSLSLEYVMVRGFDNQAEYTQSGTNLKYIAVNRNVDQFLIGANLRL